MQNWREDRELDEQGLAIKGEQSDFNLSLSLAVTGKVMRVGITTRHIKKGYFGLWWAPKGTNWTEADMISGRQTFLDLMELKSANVKDAPEDQRMELGAGAASGAHWAVATSGAPQEGMVEVDLSDSESSQGDRQDLRFSPECSGEEEKEEEGPREAASGALRGGVKQARINAMTMEERERVQARATRVHRQVHFGEFGDRPVASAMHSAGEEAAETREDVDQDIEEKVLSRPSAEGVHRGNHAQERPSEARRQKVGRGAGLRVAQGALPRRAQSPV